MLHAVFSFQFRNPHSDTPTFLGMTPNINFSSLTPQPIQFQS
jgi:hypothetical protein